MLKSKKFNLKLKKFNLPISVIGVVAIGALCAAVPTSGQYTTDITQVVQNNIAQAAVQQINQILCLISNSNYFNYTNQGWQFAMVDINMCNTSGNPGQQSDGNNATGIPNYFNILFNSTRSGSGPQVVDFSMTASLNLGGDGSPQPVKILAVLTATASPTTDNYYGVFDMEIAGYPQSDTDFTNPVIMGYIRSSLNSDGVPVLQQYLTSGGSNNTNQVYLIGDGIASGYGKAAIPNNGETQLLPMAYNSNNLYVQESGSGGSGDLCYDRNQIESYAYQYGVYNQDGSALAHSNSGYPVTYQGLQGFYDYYGISLPNGMAPTNGSAITYTDASGNNHSGTVILESGLMQVYTPQPYTLAELNGVQMSVPEPNQQFNGSNMSDIIIWNGSGFSKIGTQNCSSNGCATTLSTPTPYGQTQFESIAQTSGNGSTGTVGIFLNGLGAGGGTQFTIFESCSFASQSGGYQPPICSGYVDPTNATILNTWNVASLPPVLSSESEMLYCTSQCPYESSGIWYSAQPGMDGSGGQLNGQNLPYLVYSFDPVNYTLTLESNSVLPQQLIVDTNLNDFGVFTGPLITESQFNQIGGMVESTQTPNFESLYNGTISQYYQWQTSGQSYNQYTAIISGGSVVTLSSPLQLIYSSSGGNNFMQYSGVGNLQGVPGVCYIESQGVLTPTQSCGGIGTIWEPAYNIPTGSTVSDLFGHTYYIKQLFVSQQLIQESGSSNSCSTNADLAANLASAAALTLPESSSWVNPTETVSSIAPESATLVVINGVAVGS